MKAASTQQVPQAVASYGMVLGQVLQQRRKQLNLDQSKLAASLGIQQPAYSRLESGQSSISVAQLRALARALKTTPSDLVRDADRFAASLQKQGVSVPDEKQESNSPALIIGLGILLAILAARG